MKTLNRFALAIAVSLVLLSCSNTSNGQGQSTANSLFESTGSFTDILDSSFVLKKDYVLTEIPVMDSRVVAYKKGMYGNSLGYSGITDDGEVLAAWFPNALGSGKANSDCDYFAIYASTYSAPFSHYLVLSNDKALHAITCTIQGDGFYVTDDFIYEAMLVCGDKAGALKRGIDADSLRIYREPNWTCGGTGGPNPEDIFFER